MSIADRLYTVDEFEQMIALPENRERLLELIHGRIHEKVPTELHGKAAVKLAKYLDNHVEDNDIDGHVGVEVRHQLPKDRHNSRLPDISVRLTDEPAVSQGAVPQMPDIAVEIQSPDDSIDALRDRIEYFLQNGSRLGWILYPETQTADACTLENGILKIEAIDADGSLDGRDVLPGFTVALIKLFPKKK
jgi:Uma2 family endonuclease